MNPSIIFERRKHFDNQIKNYLQSKVQVRQPQEARRRHQLNVPKAPYHTVTGQAYYKVKNGRKHLCGSLIRN